MSTMEPQQQRKRRGARGAMDFHAASKSTALRTHSAGTQAFDPATTKTLVSKLFGYQSWEQGTQTVVSARFLSSIDGSQYWEDSITEMGTFHSFESDGDTLLPERAIGTNPKAAKVDAATTREKIPDLPLAMWQPSSLTPKTAQRVQLVTTLKRKPEIRELNFHRESACQGRTYTPVEARYLSSKVTFDLEEPTYANLRDLVGRHFGLSANEDLEMRLAKVDYRHLVKNISRLVDDQDVVTALRMHQRDILKIRVIRRLSDFNPVALASPRQPDSARANTHVGRYGKGRHVKYRRAGPENSLGIYTHPSGPPNVHSAQGAEELFEQATRRYLRIESEMAQGGGTIPHDLKHEMQIIVDMWSRAAQLGHVGAVHNLYCMEFLGLGEANAHHEPDGDGDSSYMLTQLGVFEDDEGEDLQVENENESHEIIDENDMVSLLSAPI